MATIRADRGGGIGVETVKLSDAQTGTGPSTNVMDRGANIGPALLKLTTAVGATPTCTYLIEGSMDGTSWFPVPYADSATPATIVGTTFVVTTAATFWKLLAFSLWRFLRVTLSANTNVTSTIDVYA